MVHVMASPADEELQVSPPLSLRYHSDQLHFHSWIMFKEFYHNGEFCDIVLNVGSLNIRAHRVILAAFSPYFRDLFHQPSSEHCSRITLPGKLREDIVKQLIDFCYSRDITVDTQNAENILSVASVLQVKEVEKLCVTFLAAQQALKPEGSTSPNAQAMVQKKSNKGANSREFAYADTSGIGSNNTSPRHSSRPSSEPSGNGSVIIQPLEMEDNDSEAINCKKEREDREESPSAFFNSPSFTSHMRGDYDLYRPSPAIFPGMMFPRGSSPMSMPYLAHAPFHHRMTSPHLLMKSTAALNHTQSQPLPLQSQSSQSSHSQKSQKPQSPALPQSQSSSQSKRSHSSDTSPTDMKEVGQLYSSMVNTPKSESTPSEDSLNTSAEESQSLPPDVNQCSICETFYPTEISLKLHMAEHKDEDISDYPIATKMRKSSKRAPGQLSEEEIEKYGRQNMCTTCGKCFRDPQSLKFHRYNHLLRYQCNFCGKRFSRSWNLQRHQQTHYRPPEYPGGPVTIIDVDNERIETEPHNYVLDGSSLDRPEEDENENEIDKECENMSSD